MYNIVGSLGNFTRRREELLLKDPREIVILLDRYARKHPLISNWQNESREGEAGTAGYTTYIILWSMEVPAADGKLAVPYSSLVDMRYHKPLALIRWELYPVGNNNDKVRVIGKCVKHPYAVAVFEGAWHKLIRPYHPHAVTVEGSWRKLISVERRSDEGKAREGLRELGAVGGEAGRESESNIRVPTRPKDLRRWRTTWKAVKKEWEKSASYSAMSEWLSKMWPDIACSQETLADIVRAGEAGLLD